MRQLVLSVSDDWTGGFRLLLSLLILFLHEYRLRLDLTTIALNAQEETLKKTTSIRERFFLARTTLSIREGRTVTQTELARRVGITPQSWSAYESGESEPSFDLAALIVRALGVTGGWLFFNEGDGPSAVPTYPPPADVIQAPHAARAKPGAGARRKRRG